jgi:hypothetical protein
MGRVSCEILIRDAIEYGCMVFEETGDTKLFWRKHLPSMIREKVGAVDIFCERAGIRLIKRDPTWERDLEFAINKRINYLRTPEKITAIQHVYTVYYVNKTSREEELGSVEVLVFV